MPSTYGRFAIWLSVELAIIAEFGRVTDFAGGGPIQMLNRTPSLGRFNTEAQSKAENNAGFDLPAVIALLRRQWPLIVGIALAVFGVSVLYVMVTQPRYMATANLLLDTRKLQVYKQEQPLLGESPIDDAGVESQIEVLRSASVAAAVVDELKLAEDGEFTGRASSLLDSIVSAIIDLVSSPGPALDSTNDTALEARRGAAIDYLQSNLQVRRLRITYILQIGFSSLDAGKAARLANAIAEAYIAEQTQTKTYTTKRAVNWIHDRMMELREKSIEADRALQDFRTQNNLVKVAGVTADEQQLADLNAQVLKAREQAAEARVRLSRINDIIASRIPDATMSAWLNNDLISKLRQQYLDATRREAEYAVRLGPDHQAVINAHKEIRQIEKAAQDELRRVAEGAKSDLAVAVGREKSVEARLAEQRKINDLNRQEYGTLAMLESSAKAYQSLHDSFLSRYVEVQQQQQQNITSTEARVITAASKAAKVWPKTSVILGFGAALGLALGGAAAFGREQFDRVFRRPAQVEQALGVECLGIVPSIATRELSKSTEIPASDVEQRLISQDLGIARQVVLTPFSRFTETIRNVKVAIDTRSTVRESHVLGVVSAVPAEGKSTISANLAQLAAHTGSRVLLIDADLRSLSLTKRLTPHATKGLLHWTHGQDLATLVWKDPTTGLEFLPAHLKRPIAHTNEILASQPMSDLIKLARERYDYIILDFPPLAPVVDAKAASHLVDNFLMVIEWGRTSPVVISESLSSAELVQTKLIGSVLNRANPSALKKIEAYKGRNYHRYYAAHE
jgi:succinoglycan biosynthesis transport protein ExoP